MTEDMRDSLVMAETLHGNGSDVGDGKREEREGNEGSNTFLITLPTDEDETAVNGHRDHDQQDHRDHHNEAAKTGWPVVILRSRADDVFTLYLVQATEVDALFEGCAPDELVNVVQRIVKGSPYVNRMMNSESVVVEGDTRADAKDKLAHERLSQRELQIVMMLGSGKSVGVIANELSLSVKTISTYRTRALEKMNLRNNADLIRYVIQHDLVA